MDKGVPGEGKAAGGKAAAQDQAAHSRAGESKAVAPEEVVGCCDEGVAGEAGASMKARKELGQRAKVATSKGGTPETAGKATTRPTPEPTCSF